MLVVYSGTSVVIVLGAGEMALGFVRQLAKSGIGMINIHQFVDITWQARRYANVVFYQVLCVMPSLCTALATKANSGSSLENAFS